VQLLIDISSKILETVKHTFCDFKSYFNGVFCLICYYKTVLQLKQLL